MKKTTLLLLILMYFQLFSETETSVEILSYGALDVFKGKSSLNLKSLEVQSMVQAGRKCNEMSDCKLICEQDDGFVYSSLEIHAEYFEVQSGETLKCWTNTPRKFLKSLTFFYYLDF